MALRINNNVVALNAQRNLGANSEMFANSITKLSTGLRINSAADDPAGLIASETFRAQISGVEMATQNSQNAVNFAKTADGALDEVLRLLRDARALAVQSASTGTSSSDQLIANQKQAQDIINSVTRIASFTSYGTKKILDGSAGTYAASTNGTLVSNISISGQFGGVAITTNSVISVGMATAATKAQVAGTRTFAALTTTLNAGSLTINGIGITTTASNTVDELISKINSISGQTGVEATWTANGAITLTNINYGSRYGVQLVDSSNILLTNTSTLNNLGVDAIATVAIYNGTSNVVATFGNGNGLLLQDTQGNSIQLTENGNLATYAACGQVNVGNSVFQIGANAGQSVSFSIGNMGASNLGKGAVGSLDLSQIDLTSNANASNAIQVIDKAIADVSSIRAGIGNFQRNTLESNIRFLGIARENLVASESAIRDTDFASETANMTKAQILQQAGTQMLQEAIQMPQAVLALLR